MRDLARDAAETALLSVAVFLALNFSVQNFRIEGVSMEPSLTEGQHVVVNKILYARLSADVLAEYLPFVQASGDAGLLYASRPPERGDVVVFESPVDGGRDLVKRVVGVPGDVIEIRGGWVVRNGRRLDEPYVQNRDRRSSSEVEVPDGFYYVLGDNRRNLSDSRDWGLLAETHVIGKVWFTYLPVERMGLVSYEYEE